MRDTHQLNHDIASTDDPGPRPWFQSIAYDRFDPGIELRHGGGADERA